MMVFEADTCMLLWWRNMSFRQFYPFCGCKSLKIIVLRHSSDHLLECKGGRVGKGRLDT